MSSNAPIASPVDANLAVSKLRELQRLIRDAVIASRDRVDLTDVAASTAADTIYGIDAIVEPIIDDYCAHWARTTPMVVICEGLEPESGKVYGDATLESAPMRLIFDPIDGTRGIMYDKRPAWSLAGLAPNKGADTRLRDIAVSVMTELPTSKMGRGDVLWAVRGHGAAGVRETLGETVEVSADVEFDPPLDELRERPIGKILTKLGKLTWPQAASVVQEQRTRNAGWFGEIAVQMGLVSRQDVDDALKLQQGIEVRKPGEAARVTAAPAGRPLPIRSSKADNIKHGFAMVSNFFPGTKVLASELMEQISRSLLGPADVTKAMVFEDQYISTGGQFYELIVGHDRFNCDLRPLFYKCLPLKEGLCVHPYDCATYLVAEEAGVILTDGLGNPLDAPLDCVSNVSWAGFANATLHEKIEPWFLAFFRQWGLEV
jgi:hypothetical protein